ncbi:MAG: hypothetical protein IJA90_03080 [Peptococcaceae bacterium]|nr:hypothetical protein [Peptococcaceae bacterium]
MMLRMAVCCSGADVPEVEQGISRFCKNRDVLIKAGYHHDIAAFLDALQRDSLWDFIAIMLPGARGMETVISARELAPETPLLWCSDDAGFAVASYRLHCNMFQQMPVTAEKITEALEHCLTDTALYA